MKDLLSTIFGNYEPYTDASGEIIRGVSGVDFQYILGVLLFGLVLYCVFRIIGSLFK